MENKKICEREKKKRYKVIFKEDPHSGKNYYNIDFTFTPHTCLDEALKNHK